MYTILHDNFRYLDSTHNPHNSIYMLYGLDLICVPFIYIWKEYMYIYTLNVFQTYIYDMNVTCNKNTDAIISFSGSWYAMKKKFP